MILFVCAECETEEEINRDIEDPQCGNCGSSMYPKNSEDLEDSEDELDQLDQQYWQTESAEARAHEIREFS